VKSERAAALHAAKKILREALESEDRYVDFGLELRVVRQPKRGERGKAYLRGRPPVVLVDTLRFGGMVDTRANPPRFCGPSVNPVVVYTDEVALPLILHGKDLPPNLLLQGAMRAGKTSTGVIWLALRILESTGSDGEWGVTGVNQERLGAVQRVIEETIPASWYSPPSARNPVFRFHNGVRVRMLSTHQTSKAAGSRVQAYSWLGSLNDEIQDTLAVDSDIEARGSEASDGMSKRLATASVKNDPAYRDWKTLISKSPYWKIFNKAGPTNPFVHLNTWEKMKGTMDEEDYRRKALAEDVVGSTRLYRTWDRGQDQSGRLTFQGNIAPIPAGGRNVTANELGRFWGGNFFYLIGHDPGSLCNVSVILQAWILPREYGAPFDPDPVWYAVREITTERSTTAEHIQEVIGVLKQYSCRPEGAKVICDPHTKGNDSTKPHETVIKAWRAAGFDASPAAKKPNGDPSVIPKDARISMMISLLKDTLGRRRLRVACDERGFVQCPKLVEAFELMETNAEGKGERDKKDKYDKSHWPAAVGYALWPIEQTRIESLRKAA
jgi:hypothetical protein